MFLLVVPWSTGTSTPRIPIANYNTSDFCLSDLLMDYVMLVAILTPSSVVEVNMGYLCNRLFRPLKH